MNEFKNDNDYSIIIFDKENNFIAKYKYSHTVFSFVRGFVTENFPKWYYVNVYVRRTGRFLKRYYRNDNFIPNKPKF